VKLIIFKPRIHLLPKFIKMTK